MPFGSHSASRAVRLTLGFASVLLVALFSLSPVARSQEALIPSNRMTSWSKPGLTSIGGIPNRTKIFKTLAPLGSGRDDTPEIQAALDACPPNEVVQLTAGVFNIKGNGLAFMTSNCTLRGAGPGKQLNTGINPVAPARDIAKFVVDPTATQLVKADRATNLNYGILSVFPQGENFGASTNLADNAELNTYSLTLPKMPTDPPIRVGDIVLIDEDTFRHHDPDVVWGPSFTAAGSGSYGWFSRPYRSIGQLMEVKAVNDSTNTVTFSTPFHYTFTTSNAAQLTQYTVPFLHEVGIENLFLFGGMGGDYHGNLPMAYCAYCWVKNVESTWSVGTSIGFYGTFRSVLRDSFIHETPDPNPGGAGYLTGLNNAASDNLFENNIMWYGNKVDVMRATGGGNVLAYNYMDDTFGSTYPESPEAGVNAGHFTTPHMELLEGNYSHNYKGDTYWGNSIYITVFRNWLSGLRAAHPPLKTYDYVTGGCHYLYGDYTGRAAVDVQAYSYYTNFVGNVLGMKNQQLLSDPYQYQSCYNGAEGAFTPQVLTTAENNTASNDDAVIMWNFGSYQASVNTACGCWTWINTTINTQLRNGNWDWVTEEQHWYGIGGTKDGVVDPMPIPNSLYLTSRPPFFGPNPWPWVDPRTGTTHTLPAMYCFEQHKMPTCLQNTTKPVD